MIVWTEGWTDKQTNKKTDRVSKFEKIVGQTYGQTDRKPCLPKNNAILKHFL